MKGVSYESVDRPPQAGQVEDCNGTYMNIFATFSFSYETLSHGDDCT
jgi:hypothetical protein